MNVKTPREFFEKALPSRFDASKVGDLEAVVQMDVTGSEGGRWNIVVKDRRMSVNEGTHQAPSLSVTVADRDFVDLINGRLDGFGAFMSGRIKIQGSLGLAMRLMEMGVL